MSVPKVQHGQRRYNNETEAQVILAAEKLYNAGQYTKAIERIAPVYYSALRAGRISKLPDRVLRLFFPMPLEYLKHAVNNLPEDIRKQPPEKIAEFLWTEFSMIRQESVLDPYARNRFSGARVLGQIKPSTAGWIAWLKLKLRRFDLYRPADNIKIMTTYLAYLYHERNGNRDNAVASYCGGPNWMKGYLRGHPGKVDPAHMRKHKKEPGDYVPIVANNFGFYSDLYREKVLRIAQEMSTYKEPSGLQAKAKPKAEGKAKAEAKANPVAPAPSRFYVQFGAFRQIDNAAELKGRLGLKNVKIVPKVAGKNIIYLVLARFDSLKAANEFLREAKAKQKDAFIPG